MNEGQKKFYDFILERVSDDNKNKAEKLLTESFSRQADGTFDSAYITAFIPELLKIIKYEFSDEVKSVLSDYKTKE
ncbi:MAG: hypothetical protein Q4F95_11090 [Oscillospiraceae bacterium]|nr:hypothetical protein [Oscillospiraceae bacterium]